MKTIKDIISELENLKATLIETMNAQTNFWNKSTDLVENIDGKIEELDNKIKNANGKILEKLNEITPKSIKQDIAIYLFIFIVALVIGAVLF